MVLNNENAARRPTMTIKWPPIKKDVFKKRNLIQVKESELQIIDFIHFLTYSTYNKQQDMARLFDIISLITDGTLDLDTLRTDAAETKVMMALDLYKRKFM